MCNSLINVLLQVIIYNYPTKIHNNAMRMVVIMIIVRIGEERARTEMLHEAYPTNLRMYIYYISPPLSCLSNPLGFTSMLYEEKLRHAVTLRPSLSLFRVSARIIIKIRNH